jgi:uncharacterized membrane protein
MWLVDTILRIFEIVVLIFIIYSFIQVLRKED